MTTKEELQAKIREFEEILAADEERCMAGRRQCRAINQRVVPFTLGSTECRNARCARGVG